MKRIAVLFILIMAGCVSTSDIVPAGKDSYMVQSSARGGLVMGSENVNALKAANAYCAGMGKVMQIRRTDTSTSLNYAAASLIFSCLSADDPEYRRPDLRKDPTTVIEDGRR
jgi:hypothetical protein